jgi:two-component sensor histidine kinase
MSAIGPCDNRAIALKVRGDEKTATSRDAESLGLIVTELVINAIKHAFNGTTKMGRSPLRSMCPERIGSSRSPTTEF